MKGKLLELSIFFPVDGTELPMGREEIESVVSGQDAGGPRP